MGHHIQLLRILRVTEKMASIMISQLSSHKIQTVSINVITISLSLKAAFYAVYCQKATHLQHKENHKTIL